MYENEEENRVFRDVSNEKAKEIAMMSIQRPSCGCTECEQERKTAMRIIKRLDAAS